MPDRDPCERDDCKRLRAAAKSIHGICLDAGLRDRKGGDPSEWPADLRVRQWPDRDTPATTQDSSRGV